MPLDDQDLRDRLRKAANGGAPRFDAAWAAAQARRASGKGLAGAWRYVLAPMLAIALGTVTWLIVAGPLGRGSDRAALGSAIVADAGVVARSIRADSKMASLNPLTDGLLEEMSETAPTDFLLTMEIPAWDEAGEREVL
ncbi:MAG: hypothetical protein PHU25_17310 [Deltaproteobacteria bacterium]|nr:hypothetical protein [Deltaproteobacteria bacterium]